ncbi:MAG TPA: 50S ribosomal protein L13 [Treponema sp.]|nr:MAG: 50S ribosomal protein L13 [Treponema sp. GWA1_62_8]OHE64460.1 MAG: 50S ribosomal protein L13 [Treponema sp. GWC1_61_84]OHE75491.1 MAG: 50S ribosomal protein L13 [Treponema sp. RIFOXYC1_FULL_61_9]HCM26704.1 50S ribosomal protein L13 [Treponema sp.]
MKTVYVKPADAVRNWFIIDAQDKVLGRVAAKVAGMVRGKEKPIFAPHHELGDYVVIINADKIAVTGRKRQDKMYYRYSGYIGGLKSFTFEALAARHPEAPLELAIKGMLPKGPLGRKLLKNVKIYSGADHPHAAQNPQPVEL